MRAQAIGLKPPWQPGDVVGRYVLVARIAVGGMAEIWLARQAETFGPPKIVAIKKISDSFSSEPEFVEMFLDEARIASQLAHPNIVEIFDLGEHAGSYYIAMEYLHGEDLAQIVRSGLIAKRPLPINFAARIIAQAAEALNHAHTKVGIDGTPLNVIHRDVSPQNLIVTYDGKVKMVDFGIAKAANRSTVTIAGQLKGKMSYMSPEQARGEPIDTRSDIFTLGVVLWESLTRTRLFRFDDAFQALAAVASDSPIPPPSQKNREIPAELDAITSRALEREKSKRFQSVREFNLALGQWIRAEGGRDPTSAEISAYMRDVFRERIAARVKLLETEVEEITIPPIAPLKFERKPTQDDRRTALTPSPKLDQRQTPAPAPKVDNRPASTPPRENVVSAEGRHTVEIRNDRRSGLKIFALLVFIAVVAGIAYQLRSGRPFESAIKASFTNDVDIETDPAGAEVQLDGENAGRAPLSLRNLTPGEHQIRASLPGHSSVSRTIHLDRPGQHLTVVLVVPETPAPADASPQAQMASRTNKPHVPRGRLTLETVPWSEVFLGERKLGDTPLIEVSVPVGRHTLRLINEEKHIKSQVLIEIQAGKTTIKKLQL